MAYIWKVRLRAIVLMILFAPAFLALLLGNVFFWFSCWRDVFTPGFNAGERAFQNRYRRNYGCGLHVSRYWT